MNPSTPGQGRQSRRGSRTMAGWATLAIAAVTVVVVVWAPVWWVLSIRNYVGWEVDRPLLLVGGVLLMGVATVTAVLLAGSASRRTAHPVLAIMGTSLALLVALFGVLLVVASVALFPGPLNAGIS